MRKMEFVPPDDFYHEELRPLDEELCVLVKRRKELSDGKPGFPPHEVIAEWATKYGFYEDFLNSIFSLLPEEEMYRPLVEPKHFIRHIPVMKSVELYDKMYSITFIRQFENASVLFLSIDWVSFEEGSPSHPGIFELSIGSEYDCRSTSGSGSGGHATQTFIVSPPLPDNLYGFNFSFEGKVDPFTKRSSSINFRISVD